MPRQRCLGADFVAVATLCVPRQRFYFRGTLSNSGTAKLCQYPEQCWQATFIKSEGIPGVQPGALCQILGWIDAHDW